MNILRTGTLLLSLAIVCPIALAQDTEEDTADEAEPRICINRNSVRTFDAISDKYVYIGEGANRHYLLTMRNQCPGLKFAQAIGLRDTTSRICSDGFGEIVYRDSPGAMRMNSCRIGKIERLESRDQAKARVEEYTTEKSDANRGMDEAEEEHR